MAKHKEYDSEFEPPKRRRRFGIRRIALIGLAILFLAIFFGVPWALQNRSTMVSLINRNAGISPMRLDVAAIEAGWFRPVRLRGIRLIDDKGSELVKVSEVETELTLVSLVMNYANLRTITVRGAEIVLDVQPGTTNLEEALKPLLNPTATSPTPSKPASRSTSFVGRIRIADAIVHARDSVDGTAWDVKVSEADIPFPTVEQPIPPMTVVGLIQQTAALPGEAILGGQFTVRTQPMTASASSPGIPASAAIAPMRMNIATNALPLQWFSLIKRRLPDLPVDRVLGVATLMADVEMQDNQHFSAQVQTAQIDALRIVAPKLIGARGAELQQIKVSGLVQLQNDRLTTRGATLQCDVGTLATNLDVPWPIVTPTLTKPWLDDADLEVQGAVDLTRMIQAVPDLVQMQDQVKLVSGNATLSAIQRRPKRTDGTIVVAPPDCNYRVQLGGLQANVRGTTMRWDQALQATVEVLANAQGQASFKADCTSEFCKIEGAGDLTKGQLAGAFDLSKMQQRLSQWFALPVEKLTGNAECTLAWQQDTGNRLVASGLLKTTPLQIINRYGQLNEPAWDGEFNIVARVEQGQVVQIDRGQAILKADGELLSATILEPISIAPPAVGMSPLPPAGIQLKLAGDIGGWQRRGQLFAGVDPGIQLGGKIELEARGALDTNHVEITQASFATEPFSLRSGTTLVRENKIVGSFQGRVDSQNIARLQVDNLLVQSVSFALVAQDAASSKLESTREGQAQFRIDPNQLMASISTVPTTSDPSAGQMIVDGQVTGTIQWRVSPQDLTWKLITDAKDLVASQRSVPTGPNQLVSTGASKPSILWEEPQARVTVSGRYDMKSGQLDIPESIVQTEWFAYNGEAKVTSDAKATQLISQGSLTYDAASVAHRLRNIAGDYLVIQGQRTQPVNISWVSSPTGNWADSLQAQSQIGWDSANVIGIEVGKAEVPIRIENGRFTSRTEIPVSKGTLRWNLDGDMAGSPITIVQAPERVIDNVAITKQMCQGWLKFVAPLLADVASVNGTLSLQIDKAEIIPTDWKKQTIAGQLQVHGANVGPGPLADQILQLVQQVRNLRKSAGAPDGGGQPTTWLQMPEQQISFAVDKGRVVHRDMIIQAGDVVISTSGAVSMDGQMELIAAVPILKDWVNNTPALQSLAGQQLQIPIRGTVQRPQVDFASFASIGQQLATAAVQNAAQKQIDKGINKLLGPLSQQLAPFQQGVQQMQQGVQQNLPQLPLPNLQNLPIPGFGGGNPFGGGNNNPPQPPAGQ